MSRSKRKHSPLKRIQWRVETAFYLFLESALACLSLESAFVLGEFLGSLAFRCSARYRGIVARNLAFTLSPHEVTWPTSDQVEQVFCRNGGNLITSLVAGRRTYQQVLPSIETHGEEAFESALHDSGALLIMAHMGNWEILTKFSNGLSVPKTFGALYRPLNNKYMNELVLSRRESEGMQLVSSRNPIYDILRLLKRQGVMCILSDQKIGKRGTYASFFGGVTPCTRLPMMIRDRAEVPVFVMSMQSLTPGRWRLNFDHVADPTQQRIMDALANGMQRSLADCFWFQDRWYGLPTHADLRAQSTEQSALYSRKLVSGIVESRDTLRACPATADLLQQGGYPVAYWDEGALPERAYFAIGESPQFRKACKAVGIRHVHAPAQAEQEVERAR